MPSGVFITAPSFLSSEITLDNEGLATPNWRDAQFILFIAPTLFI